VSVSELKSLQKWFVSQSEVEMVMFNIGDVHDVNADQKTAFTTIFWNQFNAKRGYNSFNLALAQYLEKALDDNGKFTVAIASDGAATVIAQGENKRNRMQYNNKSTKNPAFYCTDGSFGAVCFYKLYE
jgi:hypothetical protein